MATVATQSPVNLLNTSQANAVTSEQSDQFIDGVIKSLEEDKGDFAENVIKVGKWAIQVDEAFAKVTHGLANVDERFRNDFPQLTTFLAQWKGYNQASPINLLCRFQRNTVIPHFLSC